MSGAIPPATALVCLRSVDKDNFKFYNLGDWTEHFGMYPYRRPTNASNNHFIVTSSQMLLLVSAYQRSYELPDDGVGSPKHVGAFDWTSQ
jgi:hypothetical protein